MHGFLHVLMLIVLRRLQHHRLRYSEDVRQSKVLASVPSCASTVLLEAWCAARMDAVTNA